MSKSLKTIKPINLKQYIWYNITIPVETIVEQIPGTKNLLNPIKGITADIIKIAMINIHKKLTSENWKSKMLLQVHDELVFDVHHDELEKIQPMIKHEMENAFKLDVPLEVEIGIGKNWLEAH